jgi:hypothetical protein
VVTSRSWIVAPAILAVTTAIVGGWLFWSARIAGDVNVAWSPGSPACEGTAVRHTGSQRPVIEAEAGMRCVITVKVTNGSGYPVHVANAVAPMVGPRTGAVVTAENATPFQHGSAYDIDALLPLDRDLATGESTDFEVVLVLHPGGCNAGGTLWATDWPTVTVDVLGRSHELRGDKDFAFHRDGITPGCRDMTASGR